MPKLQIMQSSRAQSELRFNLCFLLLPPVQHPAAAHAPSRFRRIHGRLVLRRCRHERQRRRRRPPPRSRDGGSGRGRRCWRRRQRGRGGHQRASAGPAATGDAQQPHAEAAPDSKQPPPTGTPFFSFSRTLFSKEPSTVFILILCLARTSSCAIRFTFLVIHPPRTLSRTGAPSTE